jgi:Leucine-rich repeat (LRR) protein
LNELNLKSNLIILIEGVHKLTKLEKLFLANNRLEIKGFENCELIKLIALKELALENNPCEKDKNSFIKNIIKYLPNLKLLDGKTPALIKEESRDSE